MRCRNHLNTPTAIAVLDGFTVTGGRADGSVDYSYGGGMFNYRSSPVVQNVVFANNYAVWGGGMANYPEQLTDPHECHVSWQ